MLGWPLGQPSKGKIMKTKTTNDIILRILTNTYLFRVGEIDDLLTELFFRYINTLKCINRELDQDSKKFVDLYERLETARTIIYFIGAFYCEDFGLGAIERRLCEFNINPIIFYEAIDQELSLDVSRLSPAAQERFCQIIDFYKLLKRWKNLIVPGYKLYLAEDYYNETKANLVRAITQKLNYDISPVEWYWIEKIRN